MRVLIFVAAIAVACCPAFAQSPPMKMGLWESTTTSTTQMPPAMAEKMKGMPMAAPRTTTSKSCITPESWQKAMAFTNTPRENCTYGDKTITAQGMTFSMTCSNRGMTSTIKGVVTFDSDEKATSNMHLTMEMPAAVAGGGSVVTEIKGTSRFVSSDCGSVKPFSDGSKP